MGWGRRKKYDKTATGIVVGAVAPLTVFLLIYLFRYTEYPFSDYLVHLWQLKLTFKILSLCGFANLLIFFYYLRNKMEKAARGIIISTLMYALLFLVFEIL
jgi:hypothetical protein